MDIFAHFLWTSAFYWKHPKRWIAGLIGFMPDIISFGLFFVTRFFGEGMMRGPPGIGSIPSYVFTLYSITHSMVICIVGMSLLYYFKRHWFWISFGWPLHIAIDFFTHTEAFFPTPILWPISNWHFSGISWGTPWFMKLNYSILLLLYIVLIWRYGWKPQSDVKKKGSAKS